MFLGFPVVVGKLLSHGKFLDNANQYDNCREPSIKVDKNTKVARGMGLGSGLCIWGDPPVKDDKSLKVELGMGIVCWDGNADRGGDQSELLGLVGFQLSCPNGGYGELDR